MKRWLEEEWDSNLEDAIVLGKNTEHEPLEHDGSNAQRELEEQEARQRQEEIDKFEAPKKLRSKLIQAINRDRLMLKLSPKDFGLSNDSCGDLDVEAGMTVSGSVDGDGSIRNDLEIADDLEAYADSENAGTDAKDTSEEEEISTQTQKMMIDRLSSVHHNEIILPKKQSSFSNVCAICLDAYKTGDTVVWSNNSECQHVFHTECILDYLVHHKEESKAPCPCCRRQFLTKAQKKSRNSSIHSC